MKENRTTLLIAELNKCIDQLKQLKNYYIDFKEDFKIIPKGKKYELVILADIISDFYTCCETVFLRISKFYENDIDKLKWHIDLLDKMTLEIPGIRKNVINNETYKMLKEILKFRHFKRYYFEFEYDKDRIEYLEKKFLQSYILILEDLNRFKEFLDEFN